ncbi:immunity protein Imm33 domain-containing protein [Oerskovia enterophila]|uniref:immunity protein Imm33 domain-containing protein n=1 Tax=Oerskovia enterophila TaxID=43678 RepID=UPI00380E9886
MNDSTGQADQHWTQTLPEVAERAARLLGIDVATVATSQHVVPGGFHVWVPGRGGAQAIIGFDGAAYVRESSFSARELVAAYQAGARNDTTLAATPVNHAASAVAAMVGVLRGEPARQAGPVGPTEDELAQLVGAPFRQTTPDELAERLRGRGPGAYSILGIDRAHGPGHWYVAHFDGNAVTLLDPIANRTADWPPTEDVVRWWADGEPTRPPATVVLDARSRHGRRVWLRTTPRLAPQARGLVDWYAAQPPERVRKGLGVWHGFWWSALSAEGDDLRVAATDLTKPGIETMTWDVDPMLEALRSQVEMAAFCKVPRESIRFTHGVRVYDGVFEAPEIHVKRYAATDDATGWVITPFPQQPRGGTRLVPAHEVWRKAPHLVRYLALPTGFHAEWAAGRTSRIWNPAGDLVWDAAARDAAAEPPATPTPAAPSPSDRRPRGSVAYEDARAALDDAHASPERLLALGHGVRDAFVRNEHLVGLLPIDAEQVMIAVYRRADAAGSREAALTWVREAYFRGLEPAVDAAARVDALAADDPDGSAHVLRGWMRFNGYGFTQDASAAAADHEAAARIGNPDALFELSVLSATGQGVPVDEARSRLLLERAAEAGHPRALYNVAAEHATGRGRPHDPRRALVLYVAAADKGHGRAAFTAGVMTLTGDGTAPDAVRAGALLHQAEDLGFDVEGTAEQLPAALRDQVVALVATT